MYCEMPLINPGLIQRHKAFGADKQNKLDMISSVAVNRCNSQRSVASFTKLPSTSFGIKTNKQNKALFFARFPRLADVTSATVNAFVKSFFLHFSRFATQDRFDISQTAVKTAFLAV